MALVPKTVGNRAQVATQQEQVFELKLEGLTVREIAARLGISATVVQRRIEGACDAYVSPRLNEYRAAQDKQQAEAMRETLKILRGAMALDVSRDDDDVAGPDPELALKAVNTMLRIQERQAKLHGLDAPTRVDAVVQTSTETERWLKDILDGQEARNGEVAEALQVASSRVDHQA